MKKALLILCSAVALFAYKPGDRIDEAIAKRLGIERGIYIVDFFASWCHSCKKELPLINARSFPNATIIGVDVDEDIDAGKSFQRQLHLSFKVINDPKGEIVSKFDPLGIPAIYIIKDGQVVRTLIGAQPDIDAKITQAIEEIQ